MKSLPESIADFYIKKEVIRPDEREVYVYGVSLIVNDILSYSAILIYAALLGNVLYGLVFSTVFYILRVHCGGFHAKNVWICRMSMLLTFTSVMSLFFIIRHFNVEWIVIPLNVISMIILLPVIPVENPNKELTEEIRMKNRKQGIFSILIFAFLSVVLVIFKYNMGTLIMSTILSVAILAIIGKKINEERRKTT